MYAEKSEHGAMIMNRPQIEASCKIRLKELIQKGRNGVFFLDSHGEQTVLEVGGKDDEAAADAIAIALGSFGTPSFEICYVMRGRLQDDGADITPDRLPSRIEAAESERVHFYREREAVYGADAWPK